MHSARLKITEQYAPVHQDTDQTLTHIFDANSMSVWLTLNVPPLWHVRMSNVLIHANVQEMLTVLHETTEESVHANQDLQEILMELHVFQVRHSLS